MGFRRCKAQRTSTQVKRKGNVVMIKFILRLLSQSKSKRLKLRKESSWKEIQVYSQDSNRIDELGGPYQVRVRR
jgi:hypothetical protein